MAKVLVTGGAGFIGSHLSKLLIEHGDEVVIVDNLCDYYSPGFKQARLDKFLQGLAFSFFPADIADYRALEKIFSVQRFGRIYHLAAQAGVRYSLERPEVYGSTNLIGTLNLLRLAVKYKVGHFIFASSSSVYGNARTFPLKETEPTDCPLSLYGATKKAGETMLHAYCSTFGIQGTVFRFFNAYGPWARSDAALFIFAKKILAGLPIEVFDYGRAERDFTFVSDIVRGIALAGKQKQVYEIFNLGASHPVVLEKYIDILEKELGKRAERLLLPPRPEDIPKSHADITKAKTLLGFRPAYTVERGIMEFAEWYRGNEASFKSWKI